MSKTVTGEPASSIRAIEFPVMSLHYATKEQSFEQEVTVGAYTMPYEADIVGSLLEAHEIPVFPADYNTIYIYWLYSNALGGVKRRVNEKDAALAREVIAAALEEGVKLQPV